MQNSVSKFTIFPIILLSIAILGEVFFLAKRDQDLVQLQDQLREFKRLRSSIFYHYNSPNENYTLFIKSQYDYLAKTFNFNLHLKDDKIKQKDQEYFKYLTLNLHKKIEELTLAEGVKASAEKTKNQWLLSCLFFTALAIIGFVLRILGSERNMLIEKIHDLNDVNATMKSYIKMINPDSDKGDKQANTHIN